MDSFLVATSLFPREGWGPRSPLKGKFYNIKETPTCSSPSGLPPKAAALPLSGSPLPVHGIIDSFRGSCLCMTCPFRGLQ